MLKTLFRWYGKALERRPLITKICTSGTLMATGDALAQLELEDPFKEVLIILMSFS